MRSRLLDAAAAAAALAAAFRFNAKTLALLS